MKEVLRYLAAEGQAELEEKIENLPNSDFGAGNVQNIFNTAYALAGLVAVAFIIYGGVQYVLSQGDANKAAKARGTILTAVIGLVIVILAAAVTTFVINAIAGADA